jgi:type II secretory pathway component GspD/PulD (secretin)
MVNCLRNRKKSALPGLLALLAVSMVLSAALSAAADVAVIEVGYRDVLEMLPIVETLIAPGGKVSADQRTNSLVIVADAASIARVRDFLAGMDKPVPQAVVRVRFDSERSIGDRSLAASGRVSGDDWSVGTTGARSDGVRVRVQDRTVSADGSTEAMLRIMSGSRGYIRVGEDIPYTTRWVNLTRRYGRVVENIYFQRVDTGFDVRPVIQGNQADIEIVPRISEAGGRGGEGRVIRFTEAATRMTVPLGQWVTISESDQKANEAVRAILSYGSNSRRHSQSMSLFVSSD